MLARLRSTLQGIEDQMTLRQQVAVGTAILCVVMVVALASLAAGISRAQVRERVLLELSGLAETVLDRLEGNATSRLRETVLLADLLSTPAIAADQTRAAAIVEMVGRQMRHAVWVGYTDVNGRVKAATGGMLVGQSLVGRPWFDGGLDSGRVGQMHQDPLFGAATPADPENPWFINIEAPVMSDDRRIGTVVALLSWTWAEESRRAVQTALDPANTTDLMVLSRTGEVVLGPRRGEWPLLDNRGDLQAVASAQRSDTLARLGLTVVASRSSAVAFRDAGGLVMVIVVVGLLLAAVGVAIGAVIAQRVSRPLLEITAEADRLGRDPNHAMQRMRGSTDVIRLSQSLRDMVRRIVFAERRSVEAEERASFEAQRFNRDIEDLRRLAETDPLSGLPNRRSFMQYAADMLKHYKHDGRSFALVMIDIDRFKGVNDTYGHHAGDAVISAVANTLAKEIRPTDKVARFGGEEFLILLRETVEKDALNTAERLRARVESISIPTEGHTLKVTISLGVSLSLPTDADVHEIIGRADKALYQAKNSGRNRVIGNFEDETAEMIARAAAALPVALRPAEDEGKRTSPAALRRAS
jgi:diguanylate cyclase (GGDEF)-like protein